MTLLYAIAGADVPVRILVATILQFGISAGVFLMIEVQRRVAVRDDQVRAQRPRWA